MIRISTIHLSMISLCIAVVASIAGTGCKRARPTEAPVPGIQETDGLEVKSKVVEGPRFCQLRLGLEGKEKLWLVREGDALLIHRNENGDDVIGARRIDAQKSGVALKSFGFKVDDEETWLKGAEITVREEPLETTSLLAELGGGTVLTYEIESKRNDANRDTPIDLVALATAIKKRIDPANLRNTLVRPAGDGRIEIVLPVGNEGGKPLEAREEIDQIKSMLERVGTLEFRMIANNLDDNNAFAAAEELYPELDLAQMQKLNRANAEAGDLPRAPASPDGTQWIVHGSEARYAWLHVGPIARADWGLLNKYGEWHEQIAQLTEEQKQDFMNKNLTPLERERFKSGLWKILAEARDKNTVVRHNGLLFYSRPCLDRSLSQFEREKRKYEYFVLTRISDRIEVDGTRVSATATAANDSSSLRPVVDLKFNQAGAAQMREITRKNLPGANGQFARQMGIVFDDQLISAPSIRSEVGERVQITGEFDLDYVNSIISVVRAGALPAALKPKPVSENTVGPGTPTGKRLQDIEQVVTKVAVKAERKTFEAAGVRFGNKHEDAPRLHFGGPPRLELFRLNTESSVDDRQWVVHVFAMFGTPGRSPDEFVQLRTDSLPADTFPIATIEIPPLKSSGKPQRVSIPLNQPSLEGFFGRVVVPGVLPEGIVKVSLSFPDWKGDQIPASTYQRKLRP